MKTSYYCNICDKTIKLKSKTKQFKSRTHKDFEKCIQMNYTGQKPNFFNIAKTYTNHNKKVEA